MDREIRTLAQCKKIVSDQGFKHIRLLNLSGDVICAYNPAHGKGVKMTLEKKFQEIARRLQNIEAGVYILECRARFSGKEPTYKYYLGNKNYDKNSINDAPEIKVKTPEPVNKEQARGDKLLTLDKALDYITENATLRAENTVLKNENARLTRENATLLAELEEGDETEPGVGDENELPDKWTRLTEKLGNVFLPLADRFFDDRAEQRKLAYAKLNGKSNETSERKQKDFSKEVPPVGSPDWNSYLDWVGKLDDDNFENHLLEVEKASKAIYDELCREFEVTFEDDDDEPGTK